LIVGGFKGKVEGFFDEDVIGAIKENTGPYPLRIQRTIYKKCPLVFF